MTRALYLFGGWPGHEPYAMAQWARPIFDELAFQVDETNDIFALDQDLTGYDIIILGWNNAVTTETLTAAQEKRLWDAVLAGTGVAGWHGPAAAFRSSLSYHWMIGGSFVGHPGGEGFPHPYTVDVVDPTHEVMRGVASFPVASEQYYVMTDPDIHVLAETTFDGAHYPWLNGKTCPAAWVRHWGKGRVFYHSIGHDVGNMADENVRRLTRQGLEWAARR